MIGEPQITEGLRSLGLAPGDLVLAHSSFKSFGPIEGGPATVARALVESVSPGGTAVVPTFNFGKWPYDPAATPSVTGAICDAFRALPGAVRSLHPTHPFAAIGPRAEELMAGHDRVHPFGIDSPLHRLWRENAWVLLLGVDHRRSSMIHLAEELLQIPQINRTRIGRTVTAGGFRDRLVRRPGCSEGFNRVEPALRAAGQIREGTIGQCQALLMRSRDLVAVAESLLRADPAALLCSAPDCVRCDEARFLIAAG